MLGVDVQVNLNEEIFTWVHAKIGFNLTLNEPI